MNGLNLLFLILVAVGHTELMVTLANRLSSLPIPREVLRQFRHVDDVLIGGFPILLLWSVGLRGPALLLGGRWSELSPGWTVYFALCALGCAGLGWSVVRWRLRRIPVLQISNHSRTVDVAERLGASPLPAGRSRLLASLPGNEILRVQVSDKRYCLPRLPDEWHELSILHLTDTHFIGSPDRRYFEEIARLSAEMSPDLIVFTGDLLDDITLLPWLSETFGRLEAPLGCYYILGNHDWFYGADPIRAEFDRCGWRAVAGRVVSIEYRGHTLQIGGTERPWMGSHPDFDGANPAAAGGSHPFRLLLSHTPDHVEWARAHCVDLMLAGHIHGGQIVLPLIGPVYAPSKYGVRYVSGPYWKDPTMLYVSRGLSGKHPIRINCPPELTRIVLESPGRQHLSPGPGPRSTDRTH